MRQKEIKLHKEEDLEIQYEEFSGNVKFVKCKLCGMVGDKDFILRIPCEKK